MVIYIVTKSGADWSIFADARGYKRSNMAIFLIQRQITLIALVRFDP